MDRTGSRSLDGRLGDGSALARWGVRAWLVLGVLLATFAVLYVVAQFSGIVVPLSWPGFLTAGLVVALSVWNEFLLATIFLTKAELFTVVTSYYNFSTRFSRDWGLTSAAAMMMILPIIAIFLLLQRRFVEGLTQGGLKG